MAEEEDEVIKLKENVVTKTNEQTNQKYPPAGFANLQKSSILEELSVWSRRGKRSSFKLVLDQLVKGITHRGGLQ